jgi:hypothetical protein
MTIDVQKSDLRYVVEKMLEVIDNPAKHFIIDRLERKYKLNMESSSATSLKELEKALTDMFGLGAKILIKRIEVERSKSHDDKIGSLVRGEK